MRKIVSKQILFSALLTLLIPLSSTGQSVSWFPLVREVIVNYTDSVVRAHILVQTGEPETEDHLMYYWYKQNQIYKNMGGFSGDLLHGEYLVFDIQKNLITKGYYESGLRHGGWKYWYPNGIIRMALEYKDGLPDGKVLFYNKTGQLTAVEEYRNGVHVNNKTDASKNTEKSGQGLKIWKSDDKEKTTENDSTSIIGNEE
jgi:antitoxin component YwqK of YwqJK toxin-antitoxin module